MLGWLEGALKEAELFVKGVRRGVSVPECTAALQPGGHVVLVTGSPQGRADAEEAKQRQRTAQSGLI